MRAGPDLWKLSYLTTLILLHPTSKSSPGKSHHQAEEGTLQDVAQKSPKDSQNIIDHATLGYFPEVESKNLFVSDTVVQTQDLEDLNRVWPESLFPEDYLSFWRQKITCQKQRPVFETWIMFMPS